MKSIQKPLVSLLSDVYRVLIKTQCFHWNVKGSNFYSLHLLFEKQYNELGDEVDALAELISSLGEFVPASLSAFQSFSSLVEDAPQKQISSPEMIKALIADHVSIRDYAIKLQGQCDLEFVNNVLDDVIDKHNQMMWMLKSSL